MPAPQIANSIPTYHTAKLSSGVEVFYRKVGSTNKTNLLLLHGFPSSSRQFENLLILLSPYFHIIAPDLPGYGQTKLPANTTVSFELLADTTDLFLDTIGFDNFSVYIFDYGAPTGLRLALKNTKKINAIISQNGNAYEEGLGEEFWAGLKKLWKLADEGKLDKSNKEEYEKITKPAKDIATERKYYVAQYEGGEPSSAALNPELPLIDQLLLLDDAKAPEQQLDLFIDYRTNVKLYPEFHKYFKSTNIPILAIWGKNDDIFVLPGAHAYKRDSNRVKVVEIDGGHFSVASHTGKIAQEILDFFDEYGLFV